ncbi:MAG: P-II family nitrogen regulator [Pseudomonadota bacterium]
MNVNTCTIDFDLICVIVKNGAGGKVTRIAKKNGIKGDTVLLGRGTIKNPLLDFLDLNDVRKEIVMLISERDTALKALESLNRELELEKPDHGIAFSCALSGIFGVSDCSCKSRGNGGIANTMYKAIFTIVDKGNAEAVVEAATAAGSVGATIVNARGAGPHETHMLFSMAIEPEKEIVMILAEAGVHDAIMAEIRKQLQIDEPGKGLIFVLDVNQVYGMYGK